MKKLLLVLMVVAMASFLLVGCLGEGVVSDTEEEEEEEEVEQAVTIEIQDQYPADVKEFIRADELKVTVIFADAIAINDRVKFQAKEAYATVPLTEAEVPLFPDTTRKIWSTDDPTTTAVEVGYDFETAFAELEDCAEICLYVSVVDCCDPEDEEDVYYEVVKLDAVAPVVGLKITFDDCGECDPTPGAYFTFVVDPGTDTCNPEPCCIDDCSGIASWLIEEDTTACTPCPTVYGTGCPEGAIDCGCLIYPTPDTAEAVTYTFDFTVLDNVGNELVEVWSIVVGTDSVISFNEGVVPTTGIVYTNPDCE